LYGGIDHLQDKFPNGCECCTFTFVSPSATEKVIVEPGYGYCDGITFYEYTFAIREDKWRCKAINGWAKVKQDLGGFFGAILEVAISHLAKYLNLDPKAIAHVAQALLGVPIRLLGFK
jgi:hypothetical protein